MKQFFQNFGLSGYAENEIYPFWFHKLLKDGPSYDNVTKPQGHAARHFRLLGLPVRIAPALLCQSHSSRDIMASEGNLSAVLHKVDDLRMVCDVVGVSLLEQKRTVTATRKYKKTWTCLIFSSQEERPVPKPGKGGKCCPNILSLTDSFVLN